MEKFCGSGVFWDSDLTWINNSWPQFTPCFQNTVLQWLPCAWLWLTAPFYLFHLLTSHRKPHPISFIFCCKVFCSLLLLLVNVLDIVVDLDEDPTPNFDAKLLSSILWILTLMLHLVLVMLERTYNVVRSPRIFIFWTLSCVCMVVHFYSAIELKMFESEVLKFSLLCIKYLIMILLIGLNCFAEFYGVKAKNHNPEVSASVLRWFTFSWLNSLLLKGFRSPLKSEDVFELHPQDRSEVVVAKFLNIWEQEKRKRLKQFTKSRQRTKSSTNSVEDYNEKTALSVSWRKTSTESVSRIQGNHQAKQGDKSPQKQSQISYFKALVKCFWLEALSSNWGMMGYVLSCVISPFVLGWLIDFTKNSSEWVWHGYVYTVAFIATKSLYLSFGVMSKFKTNRLALRVNSTGIATVFRKALTVSSEARKVSTLGEIVNLMSVDSAHVEMMVNYSFWMWMTAIFLVLGIFLLYTILGLAMLSGMAVIFTMISLNFWVMHKMREYQDRIMVIKDERVKTVNEVLNGIKVIKLYGWEPMFIKKITEIRDKELSILFRYAILDGVETFSWLAAIFWMMHLMFVTFVLTDDNHYLDANISFRAMNYIDILNLSVNIMPIIVKDWIKAANSLKRLNKFLNAEDLNQNNLSRDKTDKLAARVVKADFAWESQGSPILKNISLSVEPGQLVAVVGTVGAGKSSLLSALLGEMHILTGYFNLNSSVAYVPQQAWIQNNTVRDNILFGRAYDESLYQQVIMACALQADLDIMPAGDLTEIGEKGINLSGGQKQRISLARAVYSQAEIYLLDDPLSAVDSHVGKHIFNHIMSRQGILKDKTRIMVTHGIQWLPHVDHIIVMTDGTISEAGTYNKLMDHNDAFAQFLTQYLQKEASVDKSTDGIGQLEQEQKVEMLQRLASLTSDNEEKAKILQRLVSETSENDSVFASETTDHQSVLSKESLTLSPLELAKRRLSERESKHRTISEMSSQFEVSHASSARKQTYVGAAVKVEDEVDSSRLTTDEEAALGKVKWSMYWQLVKGVGVCYFFVIVLLFACYHVLYNYTNVWLTNWNDDTSLSNFSAMSSNSSARRERNLYYLGVYTGLGIAQTIFVVAYALSFQIRHVATARKLHAELLDGIMHAPMSFFDTTPIGRILNRFSQDIETLDNDIFIEFEIAMDKAFKVLGTVVIIGYTMPVFMAVVVPIALVLYVVQQFYIRTSCQLRRITSTNKSPVYAHFSETLSGVTVIRAYEAQDRFIADSQRKVDNFQKANSASRAVNKWLEVRLEVLSYVIVAAACIFAVVSRGDLSPGLVGLAVTYALRVSSELSVFTMVFGELETHIVSVERIREFSLVKSEASWQSMMDEQADDQWPSNGQVQFIDYSTRYRPGLDLVLKSVNCTINAGEKVGIVGRTGAGKSSMVLSLFRLIEATEGKIIIDGVDISQLGLHTVRQKVTILPQEPVLFAGSLRMNLDPFYQKSDHELWTALEHSHLKSFVDSLPDKLDHSVGEGGENLSMGQRQLICLARTLLRKTKILILDEATAAVDMETDDLIQKTIRKEFHGCTILTIAHRLNTVMDYDRIMVLDAGTVAEFDTPKSLMSQPDSIFFSMAVNAGIISESRQQ